MIHIGYPKTATTSLQKGLFYELHQSGKINYFGKSFTEEHLSDFASDLFRNWIARTNFNEIPLNFSSRKLNVISLEELTAPEFFSKNFFEKKRKKSNPLFYPEKLSRLFSDKVDSIKILVSLRNQQTAIFSEYTQLYPYFRKEENVNTWRKYLCNAFKKEKSILSIYYYDDVLKRYSDFFGKDNINIILFEDFLNHRDHYFRELSNLLDISYQELKNNYKEIHLNKRVKTDNYSIRQKSKNRVELDGIFENNKIKNIWSKVKTKFNEDDLPLSLIRKIFICEKEYKISKPTKREKKMIFEKFRESNLNLIKNFDVNKERLKKHDYI